MSRRHCHSARHGARPSNCTLSNNERHHDCQNAPPFYIPHKIPMYEDVMLSNVASSLSQRPSRSATKQLCPLEHRATPRLPETLPHTNISSLAHTIGVLPRAHHHYRNTRRGARPSNCALSNDKWHAVTLTSPMDTIDPTLQFLVLLVLATSARI